jgi:transposase
VSSVASSLGTMSARDMVEALIAGERDPKVLAGLARGRMRVKHAALARVLTGNFDDHHAGLARMQLDQTDALTAQIGKLTTRIEELIAAIPAACGTGADGATGPGAGAGPDAPALPALERLDEIPRNQPRHRSGHHRRDRPAHEQVPTPGHLVSWAKLSPRTIKSGPRTAPARPAKATPT